MGGATMAMMYLMLGLREVGVEPVLLSTPPEPRYKGLYERLRARGVRVVLAGRRMRGPLYWLWLFFAAFRALLKLGIRLAHCHGTKEAAVVGLAAKLTGRRVVYTVEGDPLMELAYSSERYGLSDRLVLAASWFLGLRLADLVVGCSEWMARKLRERYGVGAVGARNPIDYERFSGAEPLGFGGAAVVAAARLDRVKGLETLLRAVASVAGRVPGLRLLLVGEGPLRERLRRLAERLGLSGRVEFLGFRPDVERVVAAAKVAVLPSLYEPFGMAAAEALAAGKPVVAARTGGLQEIVREGVDGFLFTPGDHLDLSRKLVRLFSDAELEKRMSWEARRGARRFAPQEVAKTYKRIYLRALKG